MAMTMVDVGEMRVPVSEAVMPVPVRMRLRSATIGFMRKFMRVLVMLIMRVAMFMLDRFMGMGMLVSFGHMKPDADPH